MFVAINRVKEGDMAKLSVLSRTSRTHALRKGSQHGPIRWRQMGDRSWPTGEKLRAWYSSRGETSAIMHALGRVNSSKGSKTRNFGLRCGEVRQVGRCHKTLQQTGTLISSRDKLNGACSLQEKPRSICPTFVSFSCRSQLSLLISQIAK
jgi:hypothetical protein